MFYGLRFLFVATICLITGLGNCLPKPIVGDGPIVTVGQGQVQGTVLSTPSGKLYNAFLGIPYGKTPLRFAAPETADPWTGVKNVSAYAPPCMQPSFGIPPTIGIEDCLTLNVFTTNLTGPALPVLIFVHGGGYFEGDSDHYEVQRFFEHTNMVIVFFNYRLLSLGFLSTADSTAPGNFGLLDQNLALQWIQSNIAAFNGDPTAVTLSGESAGSASVVSHLVSPKSAGLFHQLIAESGTVLNGWAFEEDPLYYAQRLGEKLLCPNLTDTVQLIDCLRQQTADDVIVKSMDITLENLTLCFVPVVEPVDGGQFITENPLTILEEGRFNQVPIIMGFNRDEGGLIYEYIQPLMKNIDDEFFNNVMPLLIRVLTDYRTNLVNISYAIKDQYYNIDLNDSSQVARAGLDVLGDMFMISGSVQTINIVSQYVPTWMYEFNYVGNWSWDYFSGEADCTHSIELIYLYNFTGVPPLDSQDDAFSASLIPLWTDFVYQGNPTPTGSPISWPPTPAGQTKFLSLDQPYQVFDEFQPSRMNFWLKTVPAIAAA